MRSEFARLFEIALDAARAQGVTDLEVILSGEDASLTRFANNAIHQNVAERNTHISVRPVIDGRTARASTNRRDEAAIRAVVEEAIAITRLTEPDPELPPLAEPEPLDEIDRHFEAHRRRPLPTSVPAPSRRPSARSKPPDRPPPESTRRARPSSG